MQDMFDESCFCDEKIKQIIKFKPEIKPTQITDYIFFIYLNYLHYLLFFQ
jgi:hypothetical protein